MTSVINRNLSDQIQNFGQENVVSNTQGNRAFVDVATGKTVNRSINPVAYDLTNAPLDNTFQINPAQYAVAVGMFQGVGISENLAKTFGAVTAATAKYLGVSPTNLYANGVPTQSLFDSLNSLRTANSQIGYNPGSGEPPWTHTVMLLNKLANQTN
jgi:hypothetical protein